LNLKIESSALQTGMPVGEPLATSTKIPWKQKCSDLFGIDPRTMALFRIWIGMLILFDWIQRATDFSGMYAANGAFTHSLAKFYWNDWTRWSVFYLSESDLWQGIVFALGILFAIAMIAGCFSRVATIGSWVLIVSLHNRMPLVDTSGDILLQLMMFWAMFLPLGNAWSVDAWRKGAKTGIEMGVHTFAIKLQVCLMYWFAVVWKWNEFWLEGEALQFALRFEPLTRPAATTLLEHSWLLTGMTYATLVLEFACPLLVFSPFFTQRVRLLIVATMIGFHSGIEVTMSVGIFVWITTACWFVFLPPLVWENRWWRLPATVSTESTQQSQPPRTWLRWSLHKTFITIPCTVCVAFAVYWNLGGVVDTVGNTTPDSLNSFGNLTTLKQRWNMFSRPPTKVWWFTAESQLLNGETVDLITGKPPEWERPVLKTHYGNQRWNKYLVEVPHVPWPQKYAEGYVRYLIARWNETHSEEEQVVWVRLHLTYEPSGPKIEGRPAVRNVLLFHNELELEKEEDLTKGLEGLEDLGF